MLGRGLVDDGNETLQGLSVRGRRNAFQADEDKSTETDEEKKESTNGNRFRSKPTIEVSLSDVLSGSDPARDRFFVE